jgi:hypothetical protein
MAMQMDKVGHACSWFAGFFRLPCSVQEMKKGFVRQIVVVREESGRGKGGGSQQAVPHPSVSIVIPEFGSTWPDQAANFPSAWLAQHCGWPQPEPHVS